MRKSCRDLVDRCRNIGRRDYTLRLLVLILASALSLAAPAAGRMSAALALATAGVIFLMLLAAAIARIFRVDGSLGLGMYHLGWG